MPDAVDRNPLPDGIDAPEKIHATMARYCALMQEIKDRTNAIRLAIVGQLPVHPRVAADLSYLQLRMVSELIALACLMAHGDLGVVLSEKMKKEDRAGVILKMLERLHPEFYPRPIRQILNSSGVVERIADITAGFLTREELPKLYGVCGDELHQGTLYNVGRFPPISESNKEIQGWYEKILMLLGNHKIKIWNSASEIWVGMEEKTTKKVFWSFMTPYTPPSDVQEDKNQPP
jgi:hypothetical protein